ncbi:MAG: PDZ domain-containing protein [Phycisphaerales bacterium]|nr:PDZ domain-containing protein [Phycisphaerales bacterium]
MTKQIQMFQCSKAGRLVFAAVVVALALGAAEVEVAVLVKGVRSEDFRERERASDQLLRLPFERLSEIEHVLALETDAEVIARLTEVALHLYLKDPRITPLEGQAGLLGISLDIEPRNGGWAIIVMEAKPGFPAYEVLRAGDRILAIDEQVLGTGYSIEAFRERVSATAAGAFLNVTLLRDGKTFPAKVQVAGLEQKGDDFVMNFIERRARLGRLYLSQLRAGEKAAVLVIPDGAGGEAYPRVFELEP